MRQLDVWLSQITQIFSVMVDVSLPFCCILVVYTLAFIDSSVRSTLNPPSCDRLSPRGYTLHSGAEDVVTLPESLAATPTQFCRDRFGRRRGMWRLGLFCMLCKVFLINNNVKMQVLASFFTTETVKYTKKAPVLHYSSQYRFKCEWYPTLITKTFQPEVQIASIQRQVQCLANPRHQ